MDKETKICTKCKIEQPLTKYSKLKRTKDGLQPRCKFCNNKYAKIYYQNNIERARKNRLNLKFNITLKAYNKLLTAQDSKCAICEKPSSQYKKRLAVDHCHYTGKIRKLLCLSCNMKLGYLEGNSERSKQFHKYLQEHNFDYSRLFPETPDSPAGTSRCPSEAGEGLE